MIVAEAQAANAQVQAAAQAPAMTESDEGQQALAQVYGQMAAINQRMTDRMREEAERRDEAYRQMEAHQEQMRVDEIDRLQRQAAQARQDAAFFQDEMAAAGARKTRSFC